MDPETSAEAEARLRQERAWAAGFFDGEGWAGAVRQTGRNSQQPVAMINQGGDKGVPEVLTRFLVAVEGAGTITGPVIRAGRQDLYRWTASSCRNVERTYERIRPRLGEIKRAQFRRALSDPDDSLTESHAECSPTDEIAWAAGLWDGEGWVGPLAHRSHAGYFVVEAEVKQSGSELPEVLTRFHRIVGAGRVYGPILQKHGWRDVYRWRTGGIDNVERVVRILWPWLGEIKREQARRALAVVRAQPQLPRGHPAWGSYKTHCVNGHEYATARLRPYVSRGVGRQRRDSKQCLVCTREQARARRQARGG